MILDAFLDGDGELFLELGLKCFLEPLGETASLFGGDGVRSFLDIFFVDLGDTGQLKRIYTSARVFPTNDNLRECYYQLLQLMLQKKRVKRGSVQKNIDSKEY